MYCKVLFVACCTNTTVTAERFSINTVSSVNIGFCTVATWRHGGAAVGREYYSIKIRGVWIELSAGKSPPPPLPPKKTRNGARKSAGQRRAGPTGDVSVSFRRENASADFDLANKTPRPHKNPSVFVYRCQDLGLVLPKLPRFQHSSSLGRSAVLSSVGGGEERPRSGSPE